MPATVAYPLPRTWHVTATKIALLTLMTLSVLTAIIAGWLLFAYGTSYDPSAPQSIVFFLTMTEIGALLPRLIDTVVFASCIALFAWGQVLSLRPTRRDLDHETVLSLVETVAHSKIDEIMAGSLDQITDMMRVPRLIESIKRDWSGLNHKVAEWAGVLALSLARDLTPLQLRVSELLLQCKAATTIEKNVQADLVELETETNQLADTVARVVALRRQNKETRVALETQLGLLQTKLAEIGQIETTNVVVLGQSAS